METTSIELKWHKIVNLAELVSIEEEIRGKSAIYVWGWYNEETNFVPYYVGKTLNLGQRLFGHLTNLKGGAYTIYSWEYACSKDFSPLCAQARENVLYSPSTIENLKKNFLDSKIIQSNVDSLLEKMHFSWCLTDKNLNCDLERFIYHKLNLTKKVGASVRGDCNKEISPTFSGDEVMVTLCQSN